jgi:hypothetical protein
MEWYGEMITWDAALWQQRMYKATEIYRETTELRANVANF